MVLIGVFIDFSIFFCLPSTYTGSVIVFSLGVPLIGYGVGVYVSAGLGAGPRDSLMMLISEKPAGMCNGCGTALK